jgi:NTE family protein
MNLFRKFFSPRQRTPSAFASLGIPSPSVRIASPSIRHEPPTETKKVNLALQGGGSHGAFTWGVLDYLLEDGRLTVTGISGASAGAVNAIMLADGLARGGPEEARRRLSEFWRATSLAGEFSGLKRTARALSRTAATPVRAWMEAFSRNLSPYDLNPLNINPLKQLIERYVDFEAVRAAGLPLFLSATDVQTGRARIFSLDELSADVVIASAALPSVFRAVELDGIPYWDGGYTSNPPILPFLQTRDSDDVLLVQIKPVYRPDIPTSSQDIAARISEIGFNAALYAELRALALASEQGRSSRADEAGGRRIRMHRVALPLDQRLSPGSALDTDYRFLEMLRQAGRRAAQSFLQTHFDDIGERATLDVGVRAQRELRADAV